MKRKVIVNVMGKRLVLDNPQDITIMFGTKKPMVFNLKVDRCGMKGLSHAFGLMKKKRRR